MLPLCPCRNVSGSRQGTSECKSAEPRPLLPRHCTSPHAVQLRGGRSATQIAAHTRRQESLSQDDLLRFPIAGSDRGHDERMPSSRAVGSSDWVTSGDLEEEVEDEEDLGGSDVDEPPSESSSAAAAIPARPELTDVPRGALTQVCKLRESVFVVSQLSRLRCVNEGQTKAHV